MPGAGATGTGERTRGKTGEGGPCEGAGRLFDGLLACALSPDCTGDAVVTTGGVFCVLEYLIIGVVEAEKQKQNDSTLPVYHDVQNHDLGALVLLASILGN